ncbi:MAG TPA: hypothetical protein VKY92_04490 [Verrucomicrobiae bacterium]|jgi:hypothetical protein|nr:hypothetical protein [Verrucomicrobiae bacterium]
MNRGGGGLSPPVLSAAKERKEHKNPWQKGAGAEGGTMVGWSVRIYVLVHEQTMPKAR